MQPPSPLLHSDRSLPGQDDAVQPRRVLVIEDNPGDARLIELMLADGDPTGFEARFAVCLADAERAFPACPADVVLLDLTLPDSHGLDTFRRLQAVLPHVPILVMSGLADESIAVQAVQEGAQDYLVKGHVDGHLLRRAIRYAIERKRTAQQLAVSAAVLRRKQEQMEEELAMARELQLALLPQAFPAVSAGVRGEGSLEFFSLYVPTGTVSGDFFDVLPLSGNSAGLFICDVMGHGVRAALVTAMMRALVEDYGDRGEDPARLLAAVNDHLVRILQRAETLMYATAAYLVIDVQQERLRFANAGHPPPLRLNRRTGAVERLACRGHSGVALGMFRESTYTTIELPLRPDDLVLLFTDGLFEVESPEGKLFGEERLASAVSLCARLPSAGLLDALLAELRRFSGQPTFSDDICLLGVEPQRSADYFTSERMADDLGQRS